MGQPAPPRAVLFDLLMATMDSISTWSAAAGSREAGLAWRDAVTERMIAAGRYVPYSNLVADAARALAMDDEAPERLWQAWERMERWPDATAIESLRIPYAFVTNCTMDLAAAAVGRSRLRPVLVLAAEEAGWYKPHPEIYRMACERLGVAVGEARFVAGAAYDAAGASVAGIPSILVERRPRSRPLPADIRAVPDLHQALAGF